MSDFAVVYQLCCACSSKVNGLSDLFAAGGGDGSNGVSCRVWKWWIFYTSLWGLQVGKKVLQHAAVPLIYIQKRKKKEGKKEKKKVFTKYSLEVKHQYSRPTYKCRLKHYTTRGLHTDRCVRTQEGPP